MKAWFHQHIHIFHHLHVAVQLFQLRVFALSRQIHGVDQRDDRAAQVSQQLGHAGLLILLWFRLYILFGGDGCNAGEGACLTKQRFTLWLGNV